ncbi:hypothetical protein WPS_12450 [Vulcanimicrobium alpinum]|uniref:Uncharacterized protein n=1 Tax=Vulcanimicrobium alpinum TaxID=3016050 RepID=A0AAN2C957_UNVUL|nr:hypothetical protein [Vulcanimicrobium alpinum]BDE05969.1 hypothetical protein WPS_12450 [Vulcanimicrobium alpinum]
MALRRIPGAAVAAAVAFLVILVSSHLRSTHQNNYVRVAYAWLHGRMWIDWPGRWMDAVQYQGHYYGVDGPVPALFMLPFVAIWGNAANQTLVAIAFAAAATGLAWVLAERLGVKDRTTLFFLALFLAAGTDVWWCAQLGDVWFLAHLVAMAFVFGAMVELSGKSRGWIVALCAVLAAGARFVEVAAFPFFAWALWTGALGGMTPTRETRIAHVRGFAIVLVAAAAVFVGYDELMWGTVLDIGHTVYYHQDSWGSPEGSPFQLGYVPYQIYSFFFRAPVLVEWLQKAQWPYVKPDTNGIALTFTSPALVLAFLAKEPRRLVVALWITTALVAAPEFLYYLNGWVQFGMRHALDFLPFLFALMALGVREKLPRWGIALIVWSALVGAWGVWYWNTFVRTGT